MNNNYAREQKYWSPAAVRVSTPKFSLAARWVSPAQSGQGSLSGEDLPLCSLSAAALVPRARQKPEQPGELYSHYCHLQDWGEAPTGNAAPQGSAVIRILRKARQPRMAQTSPRCRDLLPGFPLCLQASAPSIGSIIGKKKKKG